MKHQKHHLGPPRTSKPQTIKKTEEHKNDKENEEMWRKSHRNRRFRSWICLWTWCEALSFVFVWFVLLMIHHLLEKWQLGPSNANVVTKLTFNIFENDKAWSICFVVIIRGASPLIHSKSARFSSSSNAIVLGVNRRCSKILHAFQSTREKSLTHPREVQDVYNDKKHHGCSIWNNEGIPPEIISEKPNWDD